MENLPPRERGAFKSDVAIAENKNFLNEAMAELREDFWAVSGSKAREAKRTFVRELAQMVGGGFWAPPLTREVIVAVAAALKKAKLKSGAALLNDLKLWHVEEGHSVPGILDDPAVRLGKKVRGKGNDLRGGRWSSR